MNILQVNKYYPLIKNIIEQAKLTYSPRGKLLKNKKKQLNIKEKNISVQ